jgi:hypothetical protein
VIVIFAPYGRNEVTAAAVRLADAAAALGEDVRLVARGANERPVHPFWDARVLSGRGEGPYRAARGGRHLVFFQCDGALLEMTKVVAEGALRTAVVPWHGMRPSDAPFLAACDTVVCPNGACLESVGAHYPGLVPFLVRWDAGLEPVRREGPLADRQVRVCLYCDYATIDYHGALALALADEVLADVPRCGVTLVSTKSWPKRERAEIRRLLARWGGRVAHRRVASLAEQARTFHEHDWVVLPAARSAFGMNALRAAACGAAVVGFDVPPLGELFREAVRGALVPAATRANWMGRSRRYRPWRAWRVSA